jgi:polyisoprenyl-phosphate glycosyltransferase
MNSFLVSVIVPVFNEQKNIEPLVTELSKTLKPYNYEIVFVDDGSTDRTVSEVRCFTKDDRIKLVAFNRNFGHQTALICGYRTAQGDCVISMDADMQDPPEIIPQMIEEWQKKHVKIVYGRRAKREGEGMFKKFTAHIFYRFINILSDVPIPQDIGDFRLLDREVVNYITSLQEQSGFLRGVVAWGGYESATVYFKREKRLSGETHYTFKKMVNFALEGITSFSTKPLRIASLLGFAAATLGFLGIIYAVLGKIFLPSYWVTGWTALFVGIMFLGGVQLITIGIIGEYIGKIYKEVQQRPQYIIREQINVKSS